MFNKLFFIVAALAVALPVSAGTAHDFNPGRDYGTLAKQSLDGDCYDTKGGDRVCFRRVKGESFQVAVLDVSESPYPHTMLIDCDEYFHMGFGALDEQTAGEWVDAFCDNGRY